MIRGNLPMAIQGLVVVPLFGGFDERREEGRIFYYDATGGRYYDTVEKADEEAGDLLERLHLDGDPGQEEPPSA